MNRRHCCCLMLEGRDRIRRWRASGRWPRKGGERERLKSGRSLVCQWPKRGALVSLCAAESCRSHSFGRDVWPMEISLGAVKRAVPFTPRKRFLNREAFFLTNPLSPPASHLLERKKKIMENADVAYRVFSAAVSVLLIMPRLPSPGTLHKLTSGERISSLSRKAPMSYRQEKKNTGHTV